LAKVADTEGLWWGDLYYATGFPTFDLTFQDPYQDYAQSTRKIVAFKEYFEIPNPGAAPSARYKVMSDSGSAWSPPFAYVERTNVVGGATPESCSGQLANKDYTATYNFYMCKEGAVAPVPAPIVVASPPPVVVASPPPSPVVVAPSPAVVAVTPPSPTEQPSPSPTVVASSPPPPVPASGAAAVALSAVGAAFAALAAVALA
jgi:hypothetical protein